MFKKILIFILTISACLVWYFQGSAQDNDLILGGFHLEGDYRNLTDRNYYYAEAPLHDERWKIFRFRAENSGQATYADVFLWSLVGTDHTNDELWVAVYEDTNIQDPDPYGGSAYRVGDLKAWGYISGNIWAPGQYRHYAVPLTNVETSADIIAGQYYWITVQSSDGADVHISRGRERLPDCLTDKRGANYPKTGITRPPAGSEFNTQGIIYADNCYEWSVWGSLSSSPPQSYLKPDLNQDRQINVSDFNLFKTHFASGNLLADFNNDSKTDTQDLGILMSIWGSY